MCVEPNRLVGKTSGAAVARRRRLGEVPSKMLGLRRVRPLVCAASVLLASLGAPSARANPPGCASPTGGGEWPSYGGDLANTRSQPLENTINTTNVDRLANAWKFRSTQAPPAGGLNPGGSFSSTPIVADGCVYIGSSQGSQGGWVYALNAQTGGLVWHTRIGAVVGVPTTFLGGAIVGSPAVYHEPSGKGHVVVLISQKGSPRAVLLNQDTGAIEWDIVVDGAWPDTRIVDGRPRDAEGKVTFINASAVVYRDLLFVGISGQEDQVFPRGGFVILRMPDGAQAPQIVKTTFTIDDAEFAAGHRGASVWATTAVDTETGFAFVGTGNPASKKQESRSSNAILKVDMRETLPGGAANPDFGEVVGGYKGNVDQYYPGLDQQPLCDILGETIIYVAWSVTCLQLDLDFGASPNLFEDALGRTVVGELQKSGVYHAVYTDRMQAAWSATMGLPCFACNASSTATDGTHVFGVGVPPGQMVSLGVDRGRLNWVAPVADGVHYQSVSHAFGVAYTIDQYGFLLGFEATGQTGGRPLLRWPLQADTGVVMASVNSNGIAIARNTVYAAAGEFVLAYRVPA